MMGRKGIEMSMRGALETYNRLVKEGAEPEKVEAAHATIKEEMRRCEEIMRWAIDALEHNQLSEAEKDKLSEFHRGVDKEKLPEELTRMLVKAWKIIYRRDRGLSNPVLAERRTAKLS
jgi:hypothetical protein